MKISWNLVEVSNDVPSVPVVFLESFKLKLSWILLFTCSVLSSFLMNASDGNNLLDKASEILYVF